MSSSTTALLPKPANKKQDHPIFLRVCHSPWIAIGQKALLGLRGLIAAYMVISFIMNVDFELNCINHGELAAFEFSNVSYFTQTLCEILAFTWTFMHLHYPHHTNQPSSMHTRTQQMLSPPRQDSSTKSHQLFGVFYAAANTWPFVASFIHWVVLMPRGQCTIPYEHIWNHGWFVKFYVLNKWVINPMIAAIEVFFLCSIRCLYPFYAHIVGLVVLSWIYLGWAYVGYIVTDKYVWYFLDYKKIGWYYVCIAWICFSLTVVFFFLVICGIMWAREKMAKKSESNSHGYQQLPQ